MSKLKYSPNRGQQSSGKPSFAKDRVERGLEADSSKPLYADASKHDTREQKFALDSDGPVGGPVPDVRSPIDEADEYARQHRGLTESEEEGN
ncbi:hypothetical protein SAMN05444354_103334 [Stigmatella aurantiaca]|uniref:Uncharacterized protein n=1 Tax=Stigmatella aurantiaca TaxID=41 RepID=A0A1H7LTG8_STIAU|nr:hypothetical protein [Stigmatella aurantiaca]SEL02230.1 hypothetical protein SAMN05444354_103334 [Stigmatella aurantiaca]